MKIKSKWLVLLIVCQLGLILSSSTTYAMNDEGKTEAGISFEKNNEAEKPKTSEPSINDVKPDINGSKTGYLPNLGNIVTSFILLLSGVTSLIVVLGVISLKKIYSINV